MSDDKSTELATVEKPVATPQAIVHQEGQSALGHFPTKNQIKEYSEFLKNYDEFIESVLVKGVDYGEIPGVQKPSLFKPGAEKLEKLMFLRHEKICTDRLIEPDFIKFTYKTIVYDKSGQIKATCEGTANSKEKKYRYTTVKERDATPEQKSKGLRIEKRGQYGPYVLYLVEKEDYYDVENTIMKMAQKRSYVGAMLEATNSSGRFTQDVEDMAPEDLGAANVPRGTQPPANNPEADRLKAAALHKSINRELERLGLDDIWLEGKTGKPMDTLTIPQLEKVWDDLKKLKKPTPAASITEDEIPTIENGQAVYKNKQ